MSAPSAVDETTREGGRISLAERASRHPVAAGALSGLALWASFAPLEWSWLAWVALVPLFHLAVESGPRLRLYLGAWAGGLVFWGASLQWVRLTDATAWVAWLAMALIFSVWWPLFLALARLSVFRLRLPLMLAAPILWVGLEHLRIFPLSGFPWYYLGHSQYRWIPLIQIADVTGALGVSFLIAMVNACVVDLLSLPLLYATPEGTKLRPRQALRLWIVGLTLGSTLLYGVYRVSTARFREGPRLALAQTNFEQRYKQDPRWFDTAFDRLRALQLRALDHEPKPDLIVWPETSYPFGYIAVDPSLSTAALQDQIKRGVDEEISVNWWLEKQRDTDVVLHGMTDSGGVSMLIGSIYHDHAASGHEKYNSAILFEPGVRTTRAYHKIHLVPFGEYIPFVETMPWLMFFTPYRDGYVPALNSGRETNLLPLGDHRLAVAICFEDTVPHLTRRFFRDAPAGQGPDVLIDMSNDGWFHGSAELDMHLAVSVFRCVENRAPLARSVNTGISALIDGNGRILKTLPRLTEGVLQTAVPLDDREGWYTMLGDWLGLSCLAVCIGLPIVGVVDKRRSAARARRAA